MSPTRKGISNLCTAQRAGGESGSNLENYLFANRLAAAPAHEARDLRPISSLLGTQASNLKGTCRYALESRLKLGKLGPSGHRRTECENWILGRADKLVSLKPKLVCERMSQFASFSLRGKLGGLHACGATSWYIWPLPNIFLSRLFSKTRLKRKDFQDSPAGLGAGGPEFESGRPDQKYLACFLLLIESAVHLKPHLWNSGRLAVWICKSFTFQEFAT